MKHLHPAVIVPADRQRDCVFIHDLNDLIDVGISVRALGQTRWEDRHMLQTDDVSVMALTCVSHPLKILGKPSGIVARLFGIQESQESHRPDVDNRCGPVHHFVKGIGFRIMVAGNGDHRTLGLVQDAFQSLQPFPGIGGLGHIQAIAQKQEHIRLDDVIQTMDHPSQKNVRVLSPADWQGATRGVMQVRDHGYLERQQRHLPLVFCPAL